LADAGAADAASTARRSLTLWFSVSFQVDAASYDYWIDDVSLY
jgi:hypothetical protein